MRAEILWTASLHPSRTLASLSDDERGVLARALLEVLRASLRFRYARGERRFACAVFGRAGRPCPRCGEAVVRTTDDGRRLSLCETCQPP